MSSLTNWDLGGGYLFKTIAGIRSQVGFLQSSVITSTFCFYGPSCGWFDTCTQDYTEAQQIAETILRLEGTI